MYAAAKTYCEPGDMMPGFASIQKDCKSGGVDLLDLGPIASNMTDTYIQSLRVVAFDEIATIGSITEPVLIAPGYFKRVHRTITTWAYEVKSHQRYGDALYIFWAGIILIGVASNAWSTFVNIQAISFKSRIEDNSLVKSRRRKALAIFQRLINWSRTHITTPATFGTYHQRLYYWCTIPARFDFIVVTSFWIFSTFLSCIDYWPFAENFFWPDMQYQLVRYISDRTGVMAYASLTLMWIFAARNDGFLWATGWSYRTFSIYHRHVARVGTVLGIVHSIGYSYLYVAYSGWSGFWAEISEAWLLLGLVATITMTALLVFSHAWLRVKFYESFLFLHITLSIVTLIGLFTHTSKFENYSHYLWPVVFIWCGDRFLRLLRVVHHNYRARFGRDIVRSTRTTATYSKDSDVIRLEVWPTSSGLAPAPGHFYYLYQPTSWTGFENHPFTLGAWRSDALDFTKQEVDVDEVNEEEDEEGRESWDDAPRRSSVEGTDASAEAEQSLLQRNNSAAACKDVSLIFWVRPYDGWTRRLRDECLRSADGFIHPTLLVEGPYGHETLLESYETILLIAGGTGIASAAPHILQYLRRLNYDHESTRTTDLRLIWTARQKAFVKEMCRAELAPALTQPSFHPSFFATRRASEMEVRDTNDDANSPESKASLQGLPPIDVKYGRPNIKAIIMDIAEEKQCSERSRTAVLVCGPAGMADEARAAVHETLKRGHQHIDYFEEAFCW
ncbi:hypothetical protein AAFC00_004368 [Neodothiora populina]